MKKVFLALIFTVSLFISANAKTGDISGTFVHTDIKAYINGNYIPSYNINGWTGIVAEDLADFGFDVYWNGDERTLEVLSVATNKDGGKKETENKMPVGSFAGYIYETDIKTFVAGDEVTAFNIGGRTIIFIDELLRFGDVIWNGAERKISYNFVSPWSIDLYERNYQAETKDAVSSFSLKYTPLEVTGENLDYLDYLRLSYNKKDGMCLSFSIYQRVLFETEELYKLLQAVSTHRYDGEMLSENADIANEHMKILIGESPVTITKVTQGKGNGHTDFYFWLDCDIKKENFTSLEVNFN